MFNAVTEARYGTMLYNKNDAYVGRSFKEYGEFSERECEVFSKFVEPGSVVLDIGANIGAHTLFFAKKGCIVHAFEPQRLVFQVLCANMALNSIPLAFCYPYAVSDTEGTLMIPDLNPNLQNNFGGLNIEYFTQGNLTRAVTIDGYNFPHIDFIKIDVEGMEERVLRGAVETIARSRPVMYIENDREQKSESLLAYIQSLGYSIEHDAPPLYNPDNFKKNPVNVFENIVSKNVLCTPNDRA